MAATNRYISLNPGHLRIGKVVETSAGTSTDEIELRLLIVKADGSTNTNLTVYTITQALEVLKNYLKMGGVSGFTNAKTVTNSLPQPGPGPTQV